MALLVMPFSAYACVPVTTRLVWKLVMGWPAEAYITNAGLSQEVKHRGSHVKGDLAMNLFLVFGTVRFQVQFGSCLHA